MSMLTCSSHIAKVDDVAETGFDLFAIVVHLGSQLSRGHYVAIVYSHGRWLLFDDDVVNVIGEEDIAHYFGLTQSQQGQQSSETAYILFYQQRIKGQPPPPRVAPARKERSKQDDDDDNSAGRGRTSAAV